MTTTTFATSFSTSIHFFIVPIESSLTYDEHRQILIDRPWFPLVAVGLYLAMIFAGPKLMLNRPAYSVNQALVMWNMGLAIFSLCATFRITSTLFHQFHRSHDSRTFICFNDYDRVSGFWASLFLYSKVLEFGDTVFLILKKKEIPFLHWYHHTTVFLFCWIGFVTKSSFAAHFGSVNVAVHSLMYTYFALHAAGFRIPKVVSTALLVIQLMQMVIGLVIVYLTHSYLHSGSGCNSTDLVTICAALMYASYLFLFARLFAQSVRISRKTGITMRHKGSLTVS